jgi:hypothetical protein
MLRRLLLVLVFALFVLLVSFAVLVGGYALADVTDDAPGAKVLWWTAMGCLMLIVMDVLLLVGVLGVSALIPSDQRNPPSP